MRVDVLGPVAVSGGAEPLAVGGPRQRAVLAVLGLFGGQVVSTDSLTEAVWGEDAPRTAEHTLHNYVLRLRRLGLEIARVGDGYRLDTATDAAVLEQAAESPAEAAADDLDLAAVRSEALALVRGRPGYGLPDSSVTRARCAGLEELIETLREDVAVDALDRAVGPSAVGQLVPELRALTTAEPYRERRWEVLMLGLYRSGRQSEALDAFAEARELLDRELGIEPTPALRRVQQAVLSQDPALAGPVDAAPEAQAHALAGGGRALPGLATRLVGRADERADLEAALRTSRLVTVLGPLGAGKTRLALEVAHADPGQVWFVPLEGLAEPTSVAESVLTVVSPTSRASDPGQGVVAALATSGGLLVLDAAEQRVLEVATLAAELVVGCPSLRLLVTSRQTLRLRDEATVPIGALTTVDQRSLLADRARLADPGFTLSAADGEVADRLCALVDGLPLGIELVARHLRLLSVGELADRVDADLDRWTAGADEASIGLVGVVAAGVDELEPALRELLVRLAVLPAEADLALAHEVAAPAASEEWVFAGLASLVDRSLVQVRGGPAGVRYALLLSVRRYCLSLLDEDERRDVEQRYVAAVLRRTARLAAGLRSQTRPTVLLALDADAPHLRAALAASVDGADSTVALRVATDLGEYWLARRPSEGMAWLQRLLAVSDVPDVDRARALLQMGHLAYWLTDFDLGVRLLSEARELLSGSVAVANPVLLGRVLRRLGAIAAARDDVDAARELLADSVAVLQAAGDEPEEAVSLLHLGSLLADESRTGEALPLLVRARDALRAAGDPLQEGHALAALTLVWWKAGDLAAARGAGERAMEVFGDLGHRPTEGVVSYRLSAVLRALGERDLARSYGEVALASGRHTGTRTTTALAQLALARLELDESAPEVAAGRIVEALDLLDVAADRWVLAEALEVTARLQLARGPRTAPASAEGLLTQAGRLRALIGQPAPPAHAAELADLAAAATGAAGEGAAVPAATDPSALRSWALDLCWSTGPTSDPSAAVPST
jgi:predicted ATPase/DNA-binding SARP family transcriptional activator